MIRSFIKKKPKSESEREILSRWKRNKELAFEIRKYSKVNETVKQRARRLMPILKAKGITLDDLKNAGIGG